MSRLSSLQTLLTLASRNADGSSSTFKVESSENIRVFIDITVNANVKNLTVYVDGSPDNSNWWNIHAFSAISVIKSDSNSSGLTTSIAHPPKYIRIRYTIADAGPITFAVYMDKKAGE